MMRHRAGLSARTIAVRSTYLAAVIGTVAAVSAWAVMSAPTPVTSSSTASAGELSDDDGGAALFNLSELAPGQTALRCLNVRLEGGAGPMRLSGVVSGAGLEDFLGVVIEAGSGGRFGDCSGFDGATLFEGTLGDFMRRHREYDSGLDVGSAGTGTATFRFRLSMQDSAAAHGRSASADFRWETRAGAPALVDPLPPAPAPPADSPPGDRREPAPRKAPPGSPDDADERPGSKPGSAQPAPAPAAEQPLSPAPGAEQPVNRAEPPARVRPTPAETRRRGRRTGTHKRRPGATSRAVDPGRGPRFGPQREPARRTDRPSSLPVAIARAVRDVAARTAFPLLLLIVAGLFLLIQNRIDRGDPKLAHAPLHADPDLPFLPPPTSEGPRP